jgi:hypothetical protein
VFAKGKGPMRTSTMVAGMALLVTACSTAGPETKFEPVLRSSLYGTVYVYMPDMGFPHNAKPDVYLNGSRIFSVENNGHGILMLPPGEHALEVRVEGAMTFARCFKPVGTSVTVQAGQEQFVRFALPAPHRPHPQENRARVHVFGLVGLAVHAVDQTNWQNELCAFPLRLEVEGDQEEVAKTNLVEGGTFHSPAVLAAMRAPAVAAPGAVAPKLAQSASTLPQAGDSWTYHLREPKRADGPQQRIYVVKVASVSGNEIRDELFIDNVPSGSVVHSSGSYLVAQGASIFSPYFATYSQPQVGAIAIRDNMACKHPYRCDAKGRNAGTELVTVPAGTFEAIKVVVEHTWYPVEANALAGMRLWGERTLTIWYAPKLKRAVKFVSRGVAGESPPIDPDFVLELVSYNIN